MPARSTNKNDTGLAVHQAARISDAGHGGRVVVSDVTHRLVGGALPPGASLRDLGHHRLKASAPRGASSSPATPA